MGQYGIPEKRDPMFNRLKTLFGAKPAPFADGLLVNAYSTLALVPEPSFPHHMNGRRDDSDAEMRAQLQGFLHYLQTLGEGKMSTTRYHAMRHIQRTRHQLSFMMPREESAGLAEWALRTNSLLLLPDGQLRDPQCRVLVSTLDGSAEPEAAAPFPDDGWRRKAATEALLAARGLQPATTLPPVITEPEVKLRTSKEVGRRAIALLAVAIRAEALASGNPLPVAELKAKLPGLQSFLSPQEAAFLDAEQPAGTELPQFSWRYESLRTLEWALGLSDELPWPDQPCDAGLIAGTLLNQFKDAAGGKLRLRPAAEILDALDQHYRLHWVIRQARLENKALPEGVDAGVVSERHLALNWLTSFENSGWDETDTPT
jgi:hypothetical protein